METVERLREADAARVVVVDEDVGLIVSTGRRNESGAPIEPGGPEGPPPTPIACCHRLPVPPQSPFHTCLPPPLGAPGHPPTVAGAPEEEPPELAPRGGEADGPLRA